MKEVIFKAEALLKHFEKRKELCDAIIAKMRAKLDVSDISTRAYDFPENEEVSQLDGIIDRMRRDFANDLAKNPTLLLELCRAIEARDVPKSPFRDPWREAIEAAERLPVCGKEVAERIRTALAAMGPDKNIYLVDVRAEARNSDPRRDPGAA